MPTVVHCKRANYDVYIGRPSKWGNPFRIGVDGSRSEVIQKYRNCVLSNQTLLSTLHELRGKILGCWCKPKACHGDVLAELVNNLEVQMNRKIVQIAFAGNNEVKYDFFTDLDDLRVGDPVICDTIRGYSVGKVAGFVEASTKATNWIVQKVDVEGHKKRIEESRQAKELAEMLE